MKHLFIFTFAVLLSACSTTKNSIDELEEDHIETSSEENIDGKPQRPYQVTATIGEFKKGDAFKIEKAKIHENKLFLDITYTGGCAIHNFEFVGSMAVMKSMPPKRSVMLIHDNGGDTCESLVKQTIEIDIKALAQSPEQGSKIVLILDGFSEQLMYIYR